MEIPLNAYRCGLIGAQKYGANTDLLEMVCKYRVCLDDGNSHRGRDSSRRLIKSWRGTPLSRLHGIWVLFFLPKAVSRALKRGVEIPGVRLKIKRLGVLAKFRLDEDSFDHLLTREQ